MMKKNQSYKDKKNCSYKNFRTMKKKKKKKNKEKQEKPAKDIYDLIDELAYVNKNGNIRKSKRFLDDMYILDQDI